MEEHATIVGGGVGGTAAALALRTAGISVTLVETDAAVSWKIGETLAPAARSSLQGLAVWESFFRAGHLECHGNVSCWGQPRRDERDFIFNPHGCAWQLDRVALEKSLLHAATQAGCEVIRGAAVEKVQRSGGEWLVTAGEQHFHSHFLIDATGRRSWLGRHLGVKRIMLDQLVAVYAVATSASHTDADSRTFIESCPDGWWYAALTPGGRRTVSLQTDATLLPLKEKRDLEWFKAKLYETTLMGPLLREHDYIFASSPQITSAHSGRLERFCGEGWLAVGDAAMSFDPLSGQGILKALESGQRAATAVLAGADGLVSFAAEAEVAWSRFLQHRLSYYAMEKRWPDAPFWRRRTALPMNIASLATTSQLPT